MATLQFHVFCRKKWVKRETEIITLNCPALCLPSCHECVQGTRSPKPEHSKFATCRALIAFSNTPPWAHTYDAVQLAREGKNKRKYQSTMQSGKIKS